MENKISDFDRDMLFLSIATENLEKYKALGFSDVVRGGYELHLPGEVFEELSAGREVTERDRGDRKYPTEKYFHVHGIRVVALCGEKEGVSVGNQDQKPA